MVYLLQEGYAALQKKLRELERGSRVVYHTGVLGNDRGRNVYVSMIAQEAQQLAQLKRVCLVQRRQDEYTYDYIAVGR